MSPIQIQLLNRRMINRFRGDMLHIVSGVAAAAHVGRC